MGVLLEQVFQARPAAVRQPGVAEAEEPVSGPFWEPGPALAWVKRLVSPE